MNFRTTILFSFITLFLLTSCSRRSDVMFSASDEKHEIYLYQTNNEFDIVYTSSTFSGKYLYRNDTIFLTYNTDEQEHFKEKNQLPRRLVINADRKKVRSPDGEQDFCADNIYIDKLK